ncbi:MAG TPA: ABC transporter ATP-binding protein, partial [Alphaproteobacteria bacterium]|nr:ABC transporter ATP-binding protein [Alphaproteobacteria bacterium]
MIEVDQLVKRFGPLTAVDGVSFNVGQGEVLGFLGPNGAGKSTTMKMITGFLAPSAGSIRVCGHDVSAEPIAAKAAIGYLPEGAPAYPDMTPRTFLNFVCDVRGLAGEERRRQLDYVIENVHLESVWEQPIETLSKGFNRRVGLAQAILHDPPVLILDEPTDGLDPNQKHEVRTLIREMAREKAIIISTHILEEVEAVCSRAVVIAGGRIVADGTPDELAARAPTYNAVLLVTPAEHVERALRENVPGIGRIERLGEQHYRVYPLDGGPIIADVSDFVRSQRWPVAELTVEPPRLDEVFRRITTGEEASAGSRGA